MSFEGQYEKLKTVTKRMLLEVGIFEDEDFDDRVSTLAIEILQDLYAKNYSVREINNAIRVLQLASRF